MKMNNILCLMTIMFMCSQAHGMKRPPNSPAKDTESPLKKIAIDSSGSTLASQINSEIYMETDPHSMAKLICQPEARLLDFATKNKLYTEALSLENFLATRTDDPLHIHCTVKKNYLYAFQFFPTFNFPQAFFSSTPYDRLVDKRRLLHKIIEALIINEQEKIYACCYHITLQSLGKTLLDQKNKGISIEIVTNQSQGKNSSDWWVLSNLRENNITVLSPQNDKYEQMHHKFFIFKKNLLNKSLLVTGSYNPTPHGDTNSWDDILILDDQTIIDQYIQRFEEVKKRSK